MMIALAPLGAQRGSPIPGHPAITAPGAAWPVELRRRSAVIGVRLPRPWKWQSYGNHKTISTGLWKSRTEREISTFPQPLVTVSPKKESLNPRTLRLRRLEETLDMQ